MIDRKPIPVVVLFFSTAITLLIYWPGLNSYFILDDIPNLSFLDKLRELDTRTRILTFVFDGYKSIIGRPVSMTTFLINDFAWPSDAWGFKYTNLMIHILIGLMICLLAYRLLETIQPQHKRNPLLATLVSSLWLVNPMHVSTVLYVIQRMTQVGTLFSLAAILSYLYVRPRLNNGGILPYITASSLLAVFGLLALFSKEIGVMIPVYLAVLEFTILNRYQPITTAPFRAWRLIVVIAPAFFVFSYLVYTGFEKYHAPGRDFTMLERLLTEPRIVLEYLRQVLLPTISGRGLFHDDIIISRSILSPPQTLIAIVFMVGLLGSAWHLRKKYPVFALGVFWFFAGHALESTTIKLELYFEHRNYLPSFGLLFLIVYMTGRINMKRGWVIPTLAGIYALIHISITLQETKTWADPKTATYVWANEHPRSIRAQQAAGNMALQNKDWLRGLAYGRRAYELAPNQGGLILQQFQLKCLINKVTEIDIAGTSARLLTAKYDHAIPETMKIISRQAEENSCPPFKTSDSLAFLDALLHNEKIAHPMALHSLYYQQGMLHAEQGNLELAIRALDQSYRYNNVIDIPLQQGIWLLSAGLIDEAEKYARIARELDNNQKSGLVKHLRKKDVDQLFSLIETQKIQNMKNRTVQ